jgi:hypothetical protein
MNFTDAYTETIPADKMATSILNSPHKMKVIESLILQLRGAETNLKQTEKVLIAAIKQNQIYEAYISKLHEKVDKINTLSSRTSP